MAIQIIFDNRIKKDLKKIPVDVKTRFFKITEQLKREPLRGVPLSGELQGYRKIRIGDHRIVYKFYIKHKILVISRIEPRQGVYKN